MNSGVTEERQEVPTGDNGSKKIGTKQFIIIGIVVAVLLVVLILFFVLGGKDKEDGSGNNNGGNNNDNGTTEEKVETNNNPGVIEDKEQDGLKFTNASLVSTDNGATLTTIVQNTTSSDIEVRVFDIIVKDKDGNILVTLQGYVGGVVPANNSREIVSNVDMNLSEATDIEYKIIN